MSLLTQFKLFADYNQLMNQRLYAASAQLSDQQLRSDQSAQIVHAIEAVLAGLVFI